MNASLNAAVAQTAPVVTMLAERRRNVDDDGEIDLDIRIRLAEERLMARQQNLRCQAGAIGERVQAAIKPWRQALPLAGAVLAGAGVWWLWRGRRRGAARAPAPEQGQQQQSAPAGHADFPWLHIITLGWPLLPERWRARVSPATVNTMMSLGVPLIEHFLRRRPRPAASQR